MRHAFQIGNFVLRPIATQLREVYVLHHADADMVYLPHVLYDAVMTSPSIHIIVVLYNSFNTFATMWRSLAAQTCRDWHVVAIDNNSADGSTSMLRALSDSRLHVIENNENVGFARAVNQGFRIAAEQGAERYLLLNPDTVLPDDFLKDFISTWLKHDWLAVAPRIMCTEAPLQSWYAGGYLDYGWVFTNQHNDFSPDDTPDPREVDFASGCCLGLSIEALRRVGLLDESFFVYWEDTDYCVRLKAAGIPIMYLRDPMLLHEGGASSGGTFSPAGVRLFYSSYALMLRKHFGLRKALRMVFRVLWREHSHKYEPSGHVQRVAAALWRGLRLPILPEPRLPMR